MPKVPTALKTTYNAVITARIVAHNQLALLTSTNRPTRREVVMHQIEFTVFVCIVDDDVLERVYTAVVDIPASAKDTNASDIVRRAAKALGGMVGSAWWEYDATKATAELADTVSEWSGKLPITVPLAAYTGLATVPDDDDLYEVLHDGGDYEV